MSGPGCVCYYLIEENGLLFLSKMLMSDLNFLISVVGYFANKRDLVVLMFSNYQQTMFGIVLETLFFVFYKIEDKNCFGTSFHNFLNSSHISH